MVFALASVLFAVVGFIVARRQPQNVMGWLLLAIGICIPLGSANNYAINSLYDPGAFPAPAIVQLVGRMASLLALVLLVSSFLFFPDGRLLSGRFRWFVYLAVVAGILVEARTLFDTTALDYGSVKLANPTGIPAAAGLVRLLEVAALPAGFAAAVAGVVSLVLRYRRGTAETRHQLKWVVAALIWFVGCMAFAFVAPAMLNTSTSITDIAVAVGYPVLPISIGIAVLKYRLYDIDVVISRTLVYGALAAFITAVYVAIVVGIGTLVGSGGQPNLLLSIVATAVVAVAFQPVRERLQKVANRIVYGKRATPYEVLSQFSERVAETYAADEALPRMARVLAEGTGAERAEVWLRGGNTLRQAASWPAEANGRASLPVTGQLLPEIPESDRAVPVRHQGELLGALTVSKRRGEAMTPVEDKLLDDLASQAGLVLKNVGLTAELLARLEDLRASRQRLVAAQDEERRRLERNLHDGAQQNLVALKVKLGLAETLAEKDPEKARELVGQLKSDADEALETLRDLARGIYPPLLADKGLTAALAGQARKATLPVAIDADGVGRYPQEVEAAVYFCVLEALQNVQKYAHASRASVRLMARDGTLSFEVEDDGDGFDVLSAKKGSGLTNMADRLDALGGTVDIQSAVGAGSTLRGGLPVMVATGVAAAP
ncbi:MAG TPA: GAF domain-containing sensor histidine kinase [Candidatus Dormibacteraeota bacterium]|nr:GAF domain-containing sensor histidine kinase [Candidatus Dormibacteraeota bacterium]